MESLISFPTKLMLASTSSNLLLRTVNYVYPPPEKNEVDHDNANDWFILERCDAMHKRDCDKGDNDNKDDKTYSVTRKYGSFFLIYCIVISYFNRTVLPVLSIHHSLPYHVVFYQLSGDT